MALRLSWIHPLRNNNEVISGLTLCKSTFRDTNPTRSSTIKLDSYPGKRRCRPVRMLHKDSNRIIA